MINSTVDDILLRCENSKIVDVKLNSDGTMRVVFEVDGGNQYVRHMKVIINRVEFNLSKIEKQRDNMSNKLIAETHTYCLPANDGSMEVLLVEIPDLKPIEVTMKDIENKYGREVKIVNN